MSINFIREKRKQKYLIISFGIILLVSFIILWFGYFKKTKLAPSQISINPYYREIKIDFDIFKNTFLKEFQPFERIAPFEGEKGRENPFLPY